MSCSQRLERISAYADGALSGKERLETAEHLHSCASCRAELLSFERTKAAVSEGGVAAMPETLRDRLSEMIESDAPASRSAPKLSFASLLSPRLALAGAGAAVLAFFLLAGPKVEEPKIPLKRLLAEHVRSSRKSADIKRGILAAAPYETIRVEARAE